MIYRSHGLVMVVDGLDAPIEARAYAFYTDVGGPGTGADVRLVEAQDGHSWVNWRDRLREGLTWLFPGPLWMVYE